MLNRIVLIVIPAIAIILPVIRFSLPNSPHYLNSFYAIKSSAEVMSFPLENFSYISPTRTLLKPVIGLIPLIWTLGFILGVVHLIHSIIKKLKLINKYGLTTIDSKLIVSVGEDLQPFSFMNFIFLNLSRYDEHSLRTLLLHEEAHIRQFHFIDLIFMGLFRIVFWYNPVSWFIYKKLQENHEYLADRYVIVNGIESLSYLQLIMKHADPEGISYLESQLSRFSTLKRLKMINTSIRRKPFMRIVISGTLAIMIFVASGFINAEEKSDIRLNNPDRVLEKSVPPSIYPVQKDKIKLTSGYGMRMHPVKKLEMLHRGIDLAAPRGTEVYATADGVVLETDYKPEGAGNLILIRHDESYETFYSQLDEILVEKGQKVKKGETIGKVGSSGVSTGPHLHYEVRVNGEAVDPEPYLN